MLSVVLTYDSISYNDKSCSLSFAYQGEMMTHLSYCELQKKKSLVFIVALSRYL